MRKLKIVQIGIRHEHALGKFKTIKKMADQFDLAGIVDEKDFSTSAHFLIGNTKSFEGYKGERFITLEEALNMKDLDAALIEVPNLDLVPVGMMFAERGIPIHLDKPCGEDLPLYKKLLDLVETRHIPFQMGYVFRYNQAVRFAVDAVRSGLLGNIFEVQAGMSHNYGKEEYQQYLAAFKGGIMFNLGCHLIDFIVEMLGRPERIVPFMKSAEAGDPSFNNCLSVFEYPHALAYVNICSKDTLARRRLRIGGTRGSLEFCPMERDDGRGIDVSLKLKQDVGPYKKGEQTVGFPPENDRYAAQLFNFSQMIQGEATDPFTRAHDYLVHEMTLAASGYFKM